MVVIFSKRFINNVKERSHSSSSLFFSFFFFFFVILELKSVMQDQRFQINKVTYFHPGFHLFGSFSASQVQSHPSFFFILHSICHSPFPFCYAEVLAGSFVL